MKHILEVWLEFNVELRYVDTINESKFMTSWGLNDQGSVCGLIWVFVLVICHPSHTGDLLRQKSNQILKYTAEPHSVSRSRVLAGWTWENPAFT